MSSKEKLSAVFQPLSVLLRLLGLAPLSRNRFGFCYTSLLGATAVYCTGHSLATFAWAIVGKKVVWSIQTHVTVILMTLANGACLAVLITTTLCDCGNNLKAIYRILEEHDELSNNSDLNKNLKRNIVLEVMASIVVLLVMLRQDLYLIDAAYTHLFVLLCYYSYFAQAIGTIQFVNVVVALKRRAAEINNRLGKHFNGIVANVPATGIPFGKPYVEIFAPNARKNFAPSSADEIARLRQMHFKLQLAADSINKHFGAKLAGILLSVLIELICSVYFMSLFVTDGNPYSSETNYVNIAYWCSQKIAVLSALTISSCAAVQGSDETLPLVLQWSMSHASRGQVAAQLHDFTLQLIGKKMRFTACGLFDVDTSLLVSVAATVTTYTVVLLTAK